MRRLPGALVYLPLLLSAVHPAGAQSVGSPPAPTVRYHFGDDPDGSKGWANANFDDSAWSASQSGQWPLPALFSNGFMWVRTRVLVPSDAEGPLAIHLLNAGFPLADEIFVNGVSVGKQGSFPPRVRYTRETVFDLPAGLTAPGATAVVAFRVWYPPITHREAVALASAGFVLDGSRSLHQADRADHINALLWAGPELAINLIIVILGFGLLVFWRWVGGHSLLISAGVLIGATAFFLVNALFALGVLPLTWLAFSLLVTTIQFIKMNLMIELLWSLRSPRALALKRVLYGVIVILNVADLILHLSTTPSTPFEWSIRALTPAYVTFVGTLLFMSLWTLFVTRSNRYIAAAIAFIAAVGLLTWFGILRGFTIGQIHESYFILALYLYEAALFILLGQRAWKAWRVRDELRVEFDAAAEVQQQLVTPAVDLPGFQIQSAYLPAKQVGGDFFRVLPEPAGSVLIVVGDVSGKGLKAAMTVSAIIGALRTMPVLAPARILAALNRGLVGQMKGGFVTCCVAHISSEGSMTLANAGNPAPYRNGQEMAVEPGLPLGLLADATYGETHYQFSPSDRLTFVSDGVLEATNPQGELYGFDRTQAISTESAEKIAQAAQAFGQEDDITVLTLQFAPAEVAHA